MTDPTADTHITPINDLREHTDARDCWCQPRIEIVEDFLDASPARVIVVHTSADGRELVERHGLQ